MEEGGIRGKPLRERCRHEEVARIRDEGQHRDLKIGRLRRNHRKTCVLARRREIDKTREKALPRRQPRRLGENPERKRHDEIAECNRHAVMHPREKNRAP